MENTMMNVEEVIATEEMVNDIVETGKNVGNRKLKIGICVLGVGTIGVVTYKVAGKKIKAKIADICARRDDESDTAEDAENGNVCEDGEI